MIRELLWRGIAKLVSTKPVFRALRAYSRHRPYAHLYGYMHRFWIVPYHWPLPFAIRLHHILRHDLDVNLHDHPWDWRTIVCRGAYEEEDVFGQFHTRLAGTTRVARAEDFHRISSITTTANGGELWTLFITYKKRNSWGFLVGDPPRKVYHRDYVSPNNRVDKITTME